MSAGVASHRAGSRPAQVSGMAAVASAAGERAEQRVGGCVRPVRLRGGSAVVDRATGELVERYASTDELDGHTYVPCRNRRAAVCPSCSQVYQADAWHLLVCDLAGGKGVPADVAERPCTFATLTGPSFGAVHGLRPTGGRGGSTREWGPVVERRQVLAHPPAIMVGRSLRRDAAEVRAWLTGLAG